MLPYSKEDTLRDLKGYRNSMSEFDEAQMDYLIYLVEEDIKKEKN